jgi:DNA-binding transcriptional MerR regulator
LKQFEESAGKVASLAARDGRRRIRTVVRETGVSKELVHHYLRQGLLPRPRDRALYDDRQVRLLRQIRLLREDHHLPLETIRDLFELFDFDPARIEALTLCDSLSKRITKFATQGELLSPETMTAEGLVASVGIRRERLAEYVESRMVIPVVVDGEDRFSVYDANVIALAERGAALGVTFEWFRTIASYVRVAFDLAHTAFYGSPAPVEADPNRALADFFVRREVGDSFVLNVLHSLTHGRIRDLMEQPRPWRQLGGLENVVYRPSPSFIAKHELRRHVDEARRSLGESPEEVDLWCRVSDLLLHTGSYDEAAFFIQEGIEKWSEEPSLRFAHGKVLVLAEEPDRGRQELARATELGSTDPRVPAYEALALLARSSEHERPETVIVDSAPILELAEKALRTASRRDDWRAVEARILCGWMLASLPPLFKSEERGLRILVDARRSLAQCDLGGWLPGLHERFTINAAYLLFDCQTRGVGAPAHAETTELPDPDDLRNEICRLDPQSAFAETAFLRKSNQRLPGGGRPGAGR